jgi:uncharacterized membrane protein
MDESAGGIRWLIIVHLMLVLCLWLVPLMMYQDLPETVPIHFDSHGNPDSYAPKASWSFWSIPLVGTVLGAVALFLLRYPQSFNHPRQREVRALPEHLRPQVYVILQQMLLAVFICVDVVLLVIGYGVVASAKSGRMTQSVPLILGLAAFPLVLIVYYLPKIGRTCDRLKRIASTNSPSTVHH